MESLLSLLGLKSVTLAGLLGGGISGGLLPGPISALRTVAARVQVGALCGGVLAHYGAAPLAAELGRADFVDGVGLMLGLFGLTFALKLIVFAQEFDLKKLLPTRFGGNP